MNSLLPSPRRNTTANCCEIITITDNDALDMKTDERGDKYSSGYETQLDSESVEIEDALSRLTHVVEENLAQTHKESRENTQDAHASGGTSYGERIERISSANTPLPYCQTKVNINMTNHPISKDLAVVITRKPSTTVSDSRRSATNPLEGYKNKRLQKARHSSEKNEENAEINFESRVEPPPSKPANGPGKVIEPVYVNISYQEAEDRNLLSSDVRVKCRNPFCRKQMCLEDAKSRFKSCHHCYTYYCSQQCRLKHWEKHKLKCVFARTNSDCKKVLRMGREEDVVMQVYIDVEV